MLYFAIANTANIQFICIAGYFLAAQTVIEQQGRQGFVNILAKWLNSFRAAPGPFASR
jgi:hypothetical protein